MKDPHVWIIDDDPMVTYYIKRLCELNKGQSITTFATAKPAIDRLTTLAADVLALPDIILLDIYMPVTTGWDFLTFFNGIQASLPKKINLYVISSSIHPSDRQKATQDHNVVEYLQKPITMDMIAPLYA